jgi:ribonuclease Y
VKQKAESEIQEKRSELNREFDRREIESDVRLREIKAHEESLALLDFQLEQRQERLNRESSAIRQARDAIRDLSKNVRKRLEGVSQLDGEEVRKQLREEVLLECQDELRALRRETLEKSEQELQTQSRRILIASMQRLASKPNTDLTASLVHLPSEEMKGRLIGREGRNIKSFEAATGVTLLIDESPQLVLLSSFDPVRREIARNALEALVKDGRIHPASIEEYVKRAQDEIDLSTTQAGEDAVNKLNINGLHSEIIKLLGKLKYRFSYNQNVLDHSVETAFLASLIASEIGLDPNLAKRAGLLHDIGKAVSGEMEGSHAGIGADFIKRHGETPIVVNAVAAHHEEVKPETIYAGIVILADTISATRPGSTRRVDGELHPAPEAPGGARDVDRRRPAGVRHPGGARDPRRRLPERGDRRPRPRHRQGAEPAHRGRAAVPEHHQDHRDPRGEVHRDRYLSRAPWEPT